MCLWLAAALLLLTSDVNALPIPEGGDIVVSRAEVRKLEHLETRLASTAKSLRKGLQEAERFPDNGLAELGEAGDPQDADLAEYERYTHGVLGAQRKADRRGKKALLKEQLSSAQGSIRKMEAAADTALEHDKAVHDSARKMAIATELRRERRADRSMRRDAERLGSAKARDAAWQQREARELQRASKRASKVYKMETGAVRMEEKLAAQARASKPDHSGIEMPAKSLKEMQADGVALKSKAHGVFKAAKSLSASLNKPSRMLGEPGESISNLERELKDAKETKQMLRRDAQAALHRQQKLEDASAESALVKMRESKQSAVKDQQIRMQLKAEESKVSVMKAKAGARIKKMEAASEQLVQDSSHQFEEFSELLKTSHSTRKRADATLTDLEARMAALKTSRTMRLSADEF